MTARTFAGAVVVCVSVLARTAAATDVIEAVPSPDGGAAEASPAPLAAPPPAPSGPVAPPAPPAERMTDTPVRSPLLAEPPSPWFRGTPHEPMVGRWQTTLYGFVEFNGMHDSTQSYGPSTNNAMLARPGTTPGSTAARSSPPATPCSVSSWPRPPSAR